MPSALFAISGGLNLAGSLFGATSALRAGKAEAGSLREQARLLEEQANETIRRQRINRRAQLEEARQMGGEILSAYASSGVDVGAGSPLVAREQAAHRMQQQITLGQIESERAVDSLLMQARQSRTAADAASSASRGSAIGSILGGIGGAASGFARTFE